MSKVEVIKQPRKTIKIKITVSKEKIADEKVKQEELAAKNAEIKGFRKGHAPKEMIKDHIDQGQLRGQVINNLVSHHFSAALKEHLLVPFSQPRINVLEFDFDKELIFEGEFADKPEVKLPDYKSLVKSPKILIPGKDDDEKKKPREEKINDALEKILKEAEFEICDLMIEDEVEHQLASLINQLQALRLSLESYLHSTRKTAESLREDYRKNILKNFQIDLLLNEIAKVENVQISDQEVENFIKAAPDETTRKELEKEEKREYIKSVLRRSKTLDYLFKLSEQQ